MVRAVRGLTAVACLALALGTAAAAAAFTVPPDTVTTVSLDHVLDGYGNIGGVTVDALGFVYVANFRDAVWRIAPDGSVTELSRALYGSSGNAIDARGDLYQSNFNANTIVRLRRTGTVETFASDGLSGPVGLTFGEDGDLYVCNCTAGTVSRVNAAGVVDVFARSPLLACPNGIVRDDRGDFYVVNFNSPAIVRITPDGTVHPFATIPGAGGNGHITFARGSFFVTQFRGHALYRLSRDGHPTLLAGDGSREVRDGIADSARFSYPNGIAAAPGGNVLWVNDLVGPYNRREPSTIVLRRIRLVTLADVLERAVAASEPSHRAEAVREAYDAYVEAKPGDDTRGDAVTMGFRLLGTGSAGAALALFERNVERHPDDPGANYSLGEAYRYTGQAEKAAQRYERTLTLDPKHAQAAQRLKLVRQN